MFQKYSQLYCLAKLVKLYSVVYCCIEYGGAAPSRGLQVYEQFSTVLKPIMAKVAGMSARSYMRKRTFVAEMAILAKKNWRKKCVNRDKM